MGRASAEYKQHLLDHARALKPGQIPNYQEAFGRGFELLQQVSVFFSLFLDFKSLKKNLKESVSKTSSLKKSKIEIKKKLN